MSVQTMSSPRQALDDLLARVNPVDAETVALSAAAGRILAQPVMADRDSPAADVSAMDGYAVRLNELLTKGSLPVAGEVRTGREPPPLPAGRALQIFTGGCVPPGADAVIRREDLLESIDAIRVNAESLRWKAGMNIRRQGENRTAGGRVLEPGVLLNAPQVGVAALFGKSRLSVHRRLRLSVLVTGDEVLAPEDEAAPWQVRDANGPALEALLQALPWACEVRVFRGSDSQEVLSGLLEKLLGESDAVILTGGVSMGDHDHVPQVIRESGGEVVFHKLPIRPGKPVLGAIGPQGQPVLGLPGNPVSVLCTAVRFALPALRKRAGFSGNPPVPSVFLAGEPLKPVNLWSFRPVTIGDSGEAFAVESRGSGDLASVSRSDGFIEVPPGETHAGPWPFYSWSLS